ncbi:unnamed protein product [Clonostachys chloroleuca]|uniref:ARB-07466-like C-terminal domain-containing protein n=2 Tax=Clonostachys TaxID=110564 RepID=A0AA35M7N7_9HYPO|nr:unnamed protein product [Clonostachys chloroleuca]
MHFSFLPLLLPLALAAVNEPCYGPSGLAGVCIAKSDCTASGGTTTTGACPADGDNILCCTKTKCKGDASACNWTSDCGGTSASNLCPGPGQMKCCSKAGSVFGGYADASIVPPVGACQKVAVDGARTVVGQFPGRVREIGCKRDCACPGDSEHCCGKAIDFMISDGGGQATLSGDDIAEWVMNHASANNVKYVIWGQKIWNPSRDKVTAWKNWRTMEDRKSITQNHW